MQKTVLTIFAASLIVGSTVQLATAAERHPHKSDRTHWSARQQFRDANDSMPSLSDEQQYWSSVEAGHVISAPAGH